MCDVQASFGRSAFVCLSFLSERGDAQTGTPLGEAFVQRSLGKYDSIHLV